MKKYLLLLMICMIWIPLLWAQAGLGNVVNNPKTVIENDQLVDENDYIRSVGKKLGVTITYNTKVNDSWNGVTYKNCKIADVVKYVKLLEYEFAKYPQGYIERSLVNTIVLGNDIAYNRQYRAGVPDPYKKVLFLSVNGAYGDASDEYLIHCMHHELVHCTDVAIWNDMYYDWPEWAKLNTKGFKYGNGGASTYDDSETDYISPVHPQKGFINRYQMSGDEEDRAEMMAFWMSDIERPDIESLLKTDPIIKQKFELLKATYEKVAGGFFNR